MHSDLYSSLPRRRRPPPAHPRWLFKLPAIQKIPLSLQAEEDS